MNKKSDIFKIDQYEDGDKEIFVYGKNLRLNIDYDDVDHEKVRNDLHKMLTILNKYWN